MKLAYKIAVRFLKSSKGQTFLIILGIAIGVSVQIFIGSLIQGLQKGLIEKTIGNSSQITISKNTDEKEIKDYTSIMNQINGVDDRIDIVSVAADYPAFLEYGDNSQSILLRGLDIDYADKIYDIKDNIVEGTYPANNNEVILGIDLQEEYGIKVNDSISVLTVNQESYECKVVGFYDLKVASINTNWAITTLNTVQDYYHTGDTITSFEIQVKENAVFEADRIAQKIQLELLDDSYDIMNWKAQNESLLSGLQGQSISSYMIQVFVLISVVLGIASVLAITVLQKSKEIGILKAMGLRNRNASYVFMFEGLILGLFGALLGVVLGLILSYLFTFFATNPDGTPVVALYISYPFILGSGLIAVISSVLASLIPAIRSSRMNPIDIIKNN